MKNSTTLRSRFTRSLSHRHLLRTWHGGIALGAALACSLSTVRADTVMLNASDTGTNSSFNAAGNWSNAAAPAAGNAYYVIGDTLQTPHTNAAVTFGGDSLTIGDGSTAGSTLALYGAGTSAVYTINDLVLNLGAIKALSNSNTVTGNSLTLLAGGGTIDQGGNFNITIASPITGSGALTLTNSGAAATGTNAISLTSTSNTYTGATVIDGNTQVTSQHAFGDSSSLTLAASGALWNLNTGTATVNNLSGVAGSDIYSNITSGGSTLTVNEETSGAMAGAITNSSTSGNFVLTKTGSGTLTLSGVNTYNGATTVADGTIDLDASTGSLATTSGLNLDGGTFIYDNTNTLSGTKSQTMGAIASALGDGTVESIKGGATSAALTFSSLGTRGAGSTRNFIVSGGTNGSTNGIYITTATAGLISQGDFFNGASYAYVDTSGTTPFVRAAVYGTDPTFLASNGGAAMATGTTNNYQVNSTIASQAAVAENTIQFTGTAENDLTLTGALTLSGGILRSGGGATVISGGSIADATSTTQLVFRVDSAADTLTIDTKITGSGTGSNGSVTKSGDGTLVMGAANSYLGYTYIAGGTVSISADSGLGNAAQANTLISIDNATLEATATFGLYNGTAGAENRTITLGNSATIDVTNGNTLTVAGPVTDENAATPGTLIKADGGTLVLSGVNTYTNGTVVGNGVLSLTGNSAAASTVSATTSGTTVTLASGTTANLVVGQVVTGTGIASNSVITSITDATHFVLSNSVNTNEGTAVNITATAGSGLGVQNNVLINSGPSVLVDSGATLSLGANALATYTGGMTLNGAGFTGQTGAFVNAAGDNTYGGLITLGSSSTISSDSGTLDLTNAGTITGSGDDLTLGGAADGTLASAIGTGTGSVTKTGTGTWQLTGASTYTGGTTVAAGNLAVNNTSGSATGIGAVDVLSGATISGGNTSPGTTTAPGGASLGVYAANVVGMITGPLTLESGAHLAPGNSVGTITMASLTLNSGSFLDYEFNSTANDFTAVTGALTLDGGAFNLYQEGTTTAFAAPGTYDLIGYGSLDGIGISALSVADEQAGYTYSFIDDTADNIIQLQVAVVPEPSTWALLLGGLGLLAFCLPRCRRS